MNQFIIYLQKKVATAFPETNQDCPETNPTERQGVKEIFINFPDYSSIESAKNILSGVSLPLN